VRTHADRRAKAENGPACATDGDGSPFGGHELGGMPEKNRQRLREQGRRLTSRERKTASGLTARIEEESVGAEAGPVAENRCAEERSSSRESRRENQPAEKKRQAD
jgi:hypothetical protein